MSDPIQNEVYEPNPLENADRPAVNLVDTIICQAVQDDATEIRFGFGETGFEIRYCVEGSFWPMLPPPPGLDRALVDRIGELAGVSTGQRNVQRNGSFEVAVDGRKCRMNVAISPCAGGESAVIAIEKISEH